MSLVRVWHSVCLVFILLFFRVHLAGFKAAHLLGFVWFGFGRLVIVWRFGFIVWGLFYGLVVSIGFDSIRVGLGFSLVCLFSVWMVFFGFLKAFDTQDRGIKKISKKSKK